MARMSRDSLVISRMVIGAMLPQLTRMAMLKRKACNKQFKKSTFEVDVTIGYLIYFNTTCGLFLFHFWILTWAMTGLTDPKVKQLTINFGLATNWVFQISWTLMWSVKFHSIRKLK